MQRVGWICGRPVPSSREYPAGLEPVWRAYGMWCLSRRAGTGPRTRAAPLQSPVWYKTSASVIAWRRGPFPIAHAPPCVTVPHLPAKLPQPPQASVSVALFHSLMNSVGFAHLGSPKVPGCGQQWKNEGATVEEVSRVEGGFPVDIFPSCNEAPALVCPRAPAYLLMDPWTCRSSTACLRTLSSQPLQSVLSLLPPIIPTLSATPSSGPSPFPMSRSASQSTKWKRHQRPALQTPHQNWADGQARGPGPPGVSPGAGPNPVCWTTKRPRWSAGGLKMPRSSGPPWTWPRWLRLVKCWHAQTSTCIQAHDLVDLYSFLGQALLSVISFKKDPCSVSCCKTSSVAFN